VTALTPADMAEARWGGFFKSASAGWYGADFVGKLEIYQPRPIPLSETAAAAISASTKACDGDYTFRRGGRDDLAIGIYVDCQKGGQRLRRAIVLFKDKNGFLYQAAFVDMPGKPADGAELAAEGLRRAALKLLGR
jgi:hypothetical protein